MTAGSAASPLGDGVHPDQQLVPEALPEKLPTNVVPLRGTSPGSVSTPPSSPTDQRSPLVEADPDNPAHQPSPIFGRATINLPEWPLVLVFVGIFIALGVAVVDSFRLGAILFGGALIVAFFLRLVLTDREAGMLKVRSRLADLVVLGSFAAGMLLVSLAVPF